jgi:hypothetical protein
MYIGGMLACNIVCVTLLYVLRWTFFIRSETRFNDLYRCDVSSFQGALHGTVLCRLWRGSCRLAWHLRRVSRGCTIDRPPRHRILPYRGGGGGVAVVRGAAPPRKLTVSPHWEQP